MGNATCSIPDCDRPTLARGWCSMHWQRWKRNGDPNIVHAPRDKTEAERFWAKVRKTDGCWLWTGYVDDTGYGRPHRGLAHRYAYEQTVGPIPAGMTLDHLCHNADKACRGGPNCPHRRCVRPDHLAPRPGRQNTRASEHTEASKNAAKTHCPKGHPYDEANTRHYRGGRLCRRCSADRSLRAYHRRKARQV